MYFFKYNDANMLIRIILIYTYVIFQMLICINCNARYM